MHLSPVLTISLFESLLEGALLPDTRCHKLLHEELHPLRVLFPEKRLLSFLPRSSLLALRLVSITTKIWVESGPRSVFSTLYLPFPFKSKEYAYNPRVPSHQVSEICERLIVNVAASETPLTTAYNIFWGAGTLPTYASLTHLCVNAPSSGSFWPLLEFRMFIQAIDFPLLRRFTIDGLSIEGVKALRWGPLTSYLDADWTSSVMWRQLTNLDITLAPSMGVADLGRSEEGMQATKILHDWIGSFGENKFEKVRFEWMGDQEGPNPFFLDEVAEMGGSEGDPRMPRIKWNGCKEVWLGGVSLSAKDFEGMTDRINGLRRVVIWMSMLGRKAKERERKVCSRGQEWVVMEVADARQNETQLTSGNATQDDTMEEIAQEYFEETELQETQRQKFKNWSRDEMGEERGGGETLCGDDDDALSDGSREVPIFLDTMCEI